MIYKDGRFGGEFGYMPSPKCQCRIEALMTVGLKFHFDFRQCRFQAKIFHLS
jgi:hypothetical protein